MVAWRMAPTVRKVQSRIGYKFNNAPYLWEALQAPGSIVRSGEIEGAGNVRHSVGFQRYPDGNRRLAILGDAVLRLALVEDWYQGDAVRERLYRIHSDVASNVNLDKVGRTNGLDALINKNPGALDDHVGPSTMAATVEAIIGAVYLDGDMNSATEVMQNLGLTARLVRSTGPKVSVPEKAESPLASTSTLDNHEEPENVSRDLEEKLETVLKLSQELQNSLVEYSFAVQRKQRLDENTQSS